MARRSRDPWERPPLRPLGWLRDHWRVGGESVHFISARLPTSFLVWLLVGIALALPAGLYILQVNMQAATADWQGRPGLTVYFQTDAPAGDVEATVEALGAMQGLREVTLTTASQALEEFRSFAGVGDMLAELDNNPLPASVRAQLAADVGSDGLTAIAREVEQLPSVAEVALEKTWLERLNDIAMVVQRLGVVMAALFGVGSILVTASSVRLAIEDRLEELRVLKLVGATRGQIRRPFLYFGALYGFGGSVIAAMLIALTLVVIEPPLHSLVGSYDQELHLVGFDSTFLLLQMIVGASLGVLGALMAVRQRLHDLEVV